MSPSDRGMLLVCVDAFPAIRQADAVLRTSGLTYTTMTESGDTMVRKRSEVGIKENARTAYHRSLSELGASPASRGRVKAAPAQPAKLTGLSRLLG